MDFNLKRCSELIKKSNALLAEGKFLWDHNKLENEELVKYLMLLSDDIFWHSRKQYLQTIELFLSKNITVDEFLKQFHQLHGLNNQTFEIRERNLENEKNLQLEPKSSGFTSIISSLATTIELFDPGIEEDDGELIGYGISEELLRFSIKENFLPKIREY